MTQDMMTLRALLEKSSDADLLREMIGFTAERLMALEVEGLTGAAHGERSADRITHRGDAGVFPEAEEGELLPRASWPRRMAEKAMAAVIQEALSTRSVDAWCRWACRASPRASCGQRLPRSIATGPIWCKGEAGASSSVTVAVAVARAAARSWAWRSARLRPRPSGPTFLRSMARRGLRGVSCSDDHKAPEFHPDSAPHGSAAACTSPAT